ncbi:MAG: ABC transporter substrate-binding protein, partial [Roseburia sp.]|nr:ABC transporter substrate-binding protein [Roseburia sp.]
TTTAAANAGADDTTTPAPAPSSSDDANYKIGVIQMMDHVALNQSYEGFVQYFADQGYVDGENITITYQNGQGETTNLSTIADQYVGDGVDLIFAIATPSAQAAAGKTSMIPIIGTAITDFEEAGLVDSNDNPGTNVSGTNDMNPIEDQLDLLFELFPDVKTVGFLYNSSEDNSVLQVSIAKECLDAKGVAYTERTVSGTNDVQQATASIVTECDAIYIPTDNVFASSMAIVGEITNDAKIPVICGESGMVQGGGFGTLGINYFNIGYQAGEMALRVLEGEDISAMPVESSTNFDYCFNADAVAALGITLPDKYAEFVVSGE